MSPAYSSQGAGDYEDGKGHRRTRTRDAEAGREACHVIMERIMVVTRLDHVQLAMPAGEEDRARRFYRDLLGLPEVPKPFRLAKRGGCWFERGELKIHLGVDPDFRPSQKAHPGLVVEGLNDLIAALENEGYRVLPDEPLDGHLRVYVDDPFGNRIELIEAG